MLWRWVWVVCKVCLVLGGIALLSPVLLLLVFLLVLPGGSCPRWYPRHPCDRGGSTLW